MGLRQVLFQVIQSILTRLLGGTVNIDINNLESLESIQVSPKVYFSSFVVSLIIGVITAGYVKYILNFVRTGEFDTDSILETIKAKWVDVLVATILTSIIIGLCTALFVVPGIIMALAYAFTTLLVIDTDVSGSDSLKASREMMKGYKWNYFVFGLSFIGWALLIPFTFGLILIWLYPYMVVANTLYYEELKKVTKK